MNQFISILRAGLLKTRLTLIWWLIVLYPLVSVLFGLLINAESTDTGISDIELLNDMLRVSNFFFPFFLVSLISLYYYYDFHATSWKFLFTMPISRSKFYFAFLFQILLLVFITWLILNILIPSGVKMYRFIKPEGETLTVKEMFSLSLKYSLAVWIAGIPLIVLHNWIASTLRNMLAPFIVGIAGIALPVAVIIVLGITGLLTKGGEVKRIMSFDPYTLPYIPAFNTIKSIQNIEIVSSEIWPWLIVSLVLLMVFHEHFTRKNIYG